MEIRISVRSLVEFILRSGNIDNRRASAPDHAMQEGSRIHRMIQRRMGPEYQAEVALRYAYNAGEYEILVEGRADGIITEFTEVKAEPALTGNCRFCLQKQPGICRQRHSRGRRRRLCRNPDRGRKYRRTPSSRHRR